MNYILVLFGWGLGYLIASMFVKHIKTALRVVGLILILISGILYLLS